MAEAPSSEPLPALKVIDPSGGRVSWRELWDYRELLYFITWRDVKVRYKQTALGALWAVLQPVLMTLVFWVFFGRLGALESRVPGGSYAVYALGGLLPWTFFATAVSSSSQSLVGGAPLITKVYFPRAVIPLAAVGAALVDFAVGLPVLIAFVLLSGSLPAWTTVAAPVPVAFLVLAAAGVGLVLAALNVRYRDFRYVVPFLMQAWLFLTPVIYPAAIVPERWRWLLYVNPVAGLVDAFRAALLGTPLPVGGVVLSAGVTLVLFGLSAEYFRRVERGFADVV